MSDSNAVSARAPLALSGKFWVFLLISGTFLYALILSVVYSFWYFWLDRIVDRRELKKDHQTILYGITVPLAIFSVVAILFGGLALLLEKHAYWEWCLIASGGLLGLNALSSVILFHRGSAMVVKAWYNSLEVLLHHRCILGLTYLAALAVISVSFYFLSAHPFSWQWAMGGLAAMLYIAVATLVQFGRLRQKLSGTAKAAVAVMLGITEGAMAACGIGLVITSLLRQPLWVILVTTTGVFFLTSCLFSLEKLRRL